MIVVWLLLQGCAPRASETTASCDAGLDDRSVGAPFRQTYCAACHASGRAGAARFGAPEGMDFDDRDALMAHAERVRARVLDGTMPPGGGPTAEERARFLAWIDCGAPGSVAPWQPSGAGRAVLGAWDVVERAEERAPGEWIVSVDGTGTGSTTVQSTLWEERWWVTPDRAALVERTAWSPRDGREVHTDVWEPPLDVIVDASSWSWSGVRIREDADGTTVRDEAWAFERSPAEDVDPRLNGAAQERIDGTDPRTGAALTLWLSQPEGVVGRMFVSDAELPEVEGFVFESRQYPQGFREDATSPLGAAGRAWSAAVLLAETP